MSEVYTVNEIAVVTGRTIYQLAALERAGRFPRSFPVPRPRKRFMGVIKAWHKQEVDEWLSCHPMKSSGCAS